MLRLADADEIDVAFAVDLAARQEEHVDAALAGAVEQFAAAVGEEGVFGAAEQRDVGPVEIELAAAGAGEQRRCRRNRRGVADRDVLHDADQVGAHGGEQLLVAEVLAMSGIGCHASSSPGGGGSRAERAGWGEFSEGFHPTPTASASLWRPP